MESITHQWWTGMFGDVKVDVCLGNFQVVLEGDSSVWLQTQDAEEDFTGRSSLLVHVKTQRDVMDLMELLGYVPASKTVSQE